MELIRGAAVAASMLEENQKRIEELGGVIPCLAIVRVGARADDLAYERGALKRMEKTGIRAVVHELPEDIAEEEFLARFAQVNADPEVDGILLFCPLPKRISMEKVREAIDPEKDVDGISPINAARVFAGSKDGFAPCTAEAVIETLRHTGCELKGKKAVVIGRSLVIGKPVAMMLLAENCTVTVCHTKTVDMPAVCREADILVAAAGSAKMVDASYLKEGAIVMDVGINVDENGKLCGDVDAEAVGEIPSMLTPVPGGIGTVTTSVLAKHVIRAAAKRA